MANERLYQFPSKATPTPSDIIYCGDASAAYDEVNVTIAALIGAYPNLLSIGGLSLTANTFVYVNNASTFTAGAFTALAASLVAGSTISAMQTTLGYTATPTASLFSGWDVNSNLSANNFNTGYITTATAGATTTLTVGSAQQQYFTGTLNQTVAMPVTSTLVLGQSWLFVNISSGTITINSSGGNAITTLGANSSTRVTCILTSGTSAGSWSAATPVAGSGVVNSGTINNLAWYAATGSTVSALATANNGVLVTSSGGVPSISSTLPSSLVIPSPKITTGIYDTNANQMFGFSATASAVNYFNFANSATGTALGLSAAGTDTNITMSTSGKGNGGTQRQGLMTGGAYSTGFAGSMVTSNIPAASATSLTNNTNKDVTSITVGAGVWDIYGNVFFNASIGMTAMQVWTSTTSATTPDSSKIAAINGLASTYGGLTAPYLTISVSGNTTVYLTCLSSFSSGTVTACGSLTAVMR